MQTQTHTITAAHLGLADTLNGLAIVTRYVGPTNHRPSRIIATHKRGSNETARVTREWQPHHDSEANHRAAAEALAEAMGHGPRVLIARGHDHDAYSWVSVALWQVEPVAHALAACRELVAACAAGADAEALALPLALAQSALAPGRLSRPPVVAGWAEPGCRIDVLDLLGQPLFSLSDSYSPVHAIACAEAAGWGLTSEMRALAQRFRDFRMGEPSPAGVAVASHARGVA